MPISLSSLPVLAAPTTSVSPDGVVTAIADPVWAGVRIKADLSGYLDPWLTNPNFDSNLTGWAAGSNGTVSTSSAWAVTGTNSMQLAWTSNSTAPSVVWSASTPLPVGSYLLTWWGLNTASSLSSVAVSFLDYAGNTVLSTTASWSMLTSSARPARSVLSVTVPASAAGRIYKLVLTLQGVGTSGSVLFDGVRMTRVGAGALRAQIVRIDSNGVWPVRGADPAIGAGPILFGYDHEAPLGQTVAYQVTPYDWTSQPLSSSASAAITVPAPVGGAAAATSPGVWAKCLDNPELSMQLKMVDWSAWSYAGRNTVQNAINTPYPDLANPFGRQASTSNPVVYTSSAAEYSALQALIQSGSVVLLQSLAAYNRPDVYAVIDDAEPTRIGLASSGRYTWSLKLIEVGRPPTTDVPSEAPGYRLADLQSTYAYLRDLKASVLQLRQLMWG